MLALSRTFVFRSNTGSEMFLLVLLISSFGLINSQGQCSFSATKTEVSALGTRRSFCEYQVTEGHSAATLKVLPGATFNTIDCHTCTCNHYGMKCCPSNRDPNTLYVPPYCTVVMDGCTPVAVRKTDNKTDCYTAQPVPVVRQHKQRLNTLMETVKEIDHYQRQQQQRGGEPLEQNEIMMMLALGGIFGGAMDNPYEPIGTTGGMGTNGGQPFMNDLNTLMMLGMMGSK